MPRPDEYAAEKLRRGDLRVDPTTGAITRPDGTRAEVLDKRTATGRVAVCQRPLVWAPAHRIVWIATHGPIPPGLKVGHHNGQRWDNRIDNLELLRHGRAIKYDRIGTDPSAVDIPWIDRLDSGQQPARDEYGKTGGRTEGNDSHGRSIAFV